MSTEIAVVEEKEDVFIAENAISLKRFPRALQKVAKTMLASDGPMTLKEASLKAGVPYDTTRGTIHRYRKKGIDFQRFIDNEATAMLKQDKIAVHRALLGGAVSGSHQHQKLYYQLTGDLKETTSTTNITLAIGINATPHSGPANGSEKGVLDVEPVVPDDVE